MNKMNPRKEFFRVPVAIIKGELEKPGITAQWTMAAEAAEYRETLAIERALKEDPSKGQRWLESQTLYDPRESFLKEELEACPRKYGARYGEGVHDPRSFRTVQRCFDE